MARPAKFDDETLLHRAMVTFWEQGWSGTSIRDLERTMDLKAPSIYRKFESKEKLFELCLDRYNALVIRHRIARYLGASENALDDLRQFFLSSIDPGARNMPLVGCLVTNTAGESPTVPTGAQTQVEQGLQAIQTALIAECSRAQDQQQLPKSCGSVQLGNRLQLDLLGLMVLARNGTDPSQLKDRVSYLFDGLR